MFRSDNFIFRETPLSAALVKAGIVKSPEFIREHKRTGLVRNKRDSYNELPSISVEFNPRDQKVA